MGALEPVLDAACGVELTSRPPRLGIVCDLLAENWPSMDLVGDMLLRSLQERYSSRFSTVRLRASYGRHFRRFKFVDQTERAINRFARYALWVSSQRRKCDLFHVIDHSYAHLVHHLPANRTVVSCNDTDAFQCLLEPPPEVRSRALRKITAHILSGLKKAAQIICISKATADELATQYDVSPQKITVIHLGVSPAFTPIADSAREPQIEQLRSLQSRPIKILHVGSTIPRKRIDLLLRSFAEIKKIVPDAALLRVGGAFSKEQQVLLRSLGLAESTHVLPFLNERELAAVYRAATLLLLPSDREGFGLPLLEAMSCGLPVVVSDIPAFREVGGEGAIYSPVNNVEEFARRALEIVLGNDRDRLRRTALIRAKKFSWNRCADATVNVYAKVLSNAATS